MQLTLGYSPLVTGVAFLPISIGSAIFSNLSTIVLMPRFGPMPLVGFGMLIASGGMLWLAQLGTHTGYVEGLLGPLVLVAIGRGMVIAPSFNTGTFGVAPQDAGVASATVTVSQQLGASVGTSLLNTIYASAVSSYLAAHPWPLCGQPRDGGRVGVSPRVRHHIPLDRRTLCRRRRHRRHCAPQRSVGPTGSATSRNRQLRTKELGAPG